MFMRVPFLFVLFLAMSLTACSNLGSAVGSAAQAYWNSRNPPTYVKTPLNPQFTYLEVLGPGNSALMVLASVDQSAVEPSRSVETWVSGSGEVLRTQSGFVVGSAGVPYLPEISQIQWGNLQGNNQPVKLEFNISNAGINQLPMVWKSVEVPSRLQNKPSPLFRRAAQVSNLRLSAWIAQAENTALRLKGYSQVFQLVATHPTTGNLVYGQYCVGASPQGQCIEYLLRTAAQNL